MGALVTYLLKKKMNPFGTLIINMQKVLTHDSCCMLYASIDDGPCHAHTLLNLIYRERMRERVGFPFHNRHHNLVKEKMFKKQSMNHPNSNDGIAVVNTFP